MAKLGGASITREQFLLREMRQVCSLHLDGLSDEDIILMARNENLFQYPTERMVGNIARVCCKRIEAVESDRIVQIIAEGMPESAAQANLYAMMCTYPLVRCFMVEVVGSRYAELNYKLDYMDMNAFMTDLQMRYDDMASISEYTVAKIKQVLRKCLVECGMLESVRSFRLIPNALDFSVAEAIAAKDDDQALYAFGCRRAF